MKQEDPGPLSGYRAYTIRSLTISSLLGLAWHCTNPVFRAILRGALLLYGDDVDLIEKYLEVSAISMLLYAYVS